MVVTICDSSVCNNGMKKCRLLTVAQLLNQLHTTSYSERLIADTMLRSQSLHRLWARHIWTIAMKVGNLDCCVLTLLEQASRIHLPASSSNSDYAKNRTGSAYHSRQTTPNSYGLAGRRKAVLDADSEWKDRGPGNALYWNSMALSGERKVPTTSRDHKAQVKIACRKVDGLLTDLLIKRGRELLGPSQPMSDGQESLIRTHPSVSSGGNSENILMAHITKPFRITEPTSRDFP